MLVAGTSEDAQRIRHWVASVLSPMGLRLSLEKTKITHIDEGLDFLGWRLQRHRKKGTIDRRYIYTYPSKKALGSIKDKVRDLCRMDINLPLEVPLHRLNRVLKGWTAYFRFGISHATFHYLRAFVWQRVIGWLRRKYRRSNWKELRRRNCGGRWWPTTEEVTLFDPAKVRTIRYSYRGTKIPSPWTGTA
ncbi:group II intron maturase-specific domain-containing protein [Streptomyces mirabilis]|uniref:group II intron maturase-specific domain-containing protein n=1 Tax=Streptomyces mirabilis TaxID=68239 RepID=UPI00368ED727